MSHPVSHEVRYRLLRYLEEHPDASQRELARHLGVSVGKINYCLHALIVKGWIRVQNFRNSKRKSAYLYLLTRKGIEAKFKLTAAFLRLKVAEYDMLSREIEQLKSEISGMPAISDEIQ
jgi:EPS-associated MarR family transcriptional regulator